MTPTADAHGDGARSSPGHATWRPLAVVMVMVLFSNWGERQEKKGKTPIVRLRLF